MGLATSGVNCKLPHGGRFPGDALAAKDGRRGKGGHGNGFFRLGLGIPPVVCDELLSDRRHGDAVAGTTHASGLGIATEALGTQTFGDVLLAMSTNIGIQSPVDVTVGPLDDNGCMPKSERAGGARSMTWASMSHFKTQLSLLSSASISSVMQGISIGSAST